MECALTQNIRRINRSIFVLQCVITTVNSRWPKKVGLLLLALMVVITFSLGQIYSNDLLRLPLITIGIASTLFLVYIVGVYSSWSREIRIKNTKQNEIILFILIAITAIVGRIADSGVIDWYYPLAILTTVIFTLRIICSRINMPIQLFQLLLLAIVLRAVPWYSYPVYGQDRFHQTAVGYILSTGDVVPESITYYADFPIAHIFTAMYTQITGLSLKAGFFILGLAVVIGLLGVFLFGRTILHNDTEALFGTLFVAVSAHHIKAGAEPFAQALFTGLVPFIFYFLFKQKLSKRDLLILLGISSIAVTIQNIVPLVLLGISFLAGVSSILFGYISRFSTRINTKDQLSIPLGAVTIFGIVGIYYYILADYLRFQTMRLVWLSNRLLGQSSSEEEITESSGVSGVPRVELFNIEMPGVLMWAAPVLVIAGVLIMMFYNLSWEFIKENGDIKIIPYASISGATFLLFAIIFVSGSPATRALPSAIIIISPVIAWGVHKFIKDGKEIGGFVVILIIFLTVTSGVLMPPVAKAELGDDDFQPWMNTEQISAADFAIDNTEDTQVSNYVVGYERYRIGSTGEKNIELTLSSGFDKNNRESMTQFQQRSQLGVSTLYLEYYSSAYNMSPPTTNKVYTTGRSYLYT